MLAMPHITYIYLLTNAQSPPPEQSIKRLQVLLNGLKMLTPLFFSVIRILFPRKGAIMRNLHLKK